MHHGRSVKLTGDGALVEFRSVVDAVRCAVEIQRGTIARSSDIPPEQRIEFRIGVHLGDVVEEADGDLMGDAVNIAARLEAVGLHRARSVYPRTPIVRSAAGSTCKSPISAQPKLKNIERSIRIYSLQVGVPALANPMTLPGPPAPRMRSSLAPLVAGVAALLIVFSQAAHGGSSEPIGLPLFRPKRTRRSLRTQRRMTEPGHLSIVVLPFANLSNDPSQDYFADGTPTENLTTDLSRLSGSFVIARNTAFAFKGKNVDSLEIGKELGVRYVLEGSVQRDTDRVRVNVQLIDAESGKHIWAKRFDKPLADLFPNAGRDRVSPCKQLARN